MSDVTIKGEIHASRGDLEEERDLLAEGVDTLVIEGSSEDEVGVSWLHAWFEVAILIFEYLFAESLYTDHQTLVDIAKGQGADVVYTRDTDAALIENSHTLVTGAAFILFYGLVFLSALLGILGNQIAGAGTLLLAGGGPVLLLRLYETRKPGDNRDKKIAEKIAQAATDDDRVVAVMGQSHAKTVPDYLPTDINPEVKTPTYGFFSFPMGRDLFVPSVRVAGTMAIVYPAFLAAFETYLALV
ncbi:hypothetical protein B4589_004575 [Halolamina sp. CBA1230]|uniref:hypothetical protein n=1 Tax=Halolamina sp. CBA1230 TaxID=1853690 RepID=UPI0009A24396|nr:hypothetical protein [Halolamina sp. CBA1230]QKY19688.1 hypothetical protein B4589_004575 [Halolamina sp. CBA1230]